MPWTPAILFYFAMALGVRFPAARKNLQTVHMQVDWPLIRRRLPVFVLPLGLIFVMLLMRYSPSNTAYWVSAATVATGFAFKDTRPGVESL